MKGDDKIGVALYTLKSFIEDNDRLCAWCVHGLLLVRDEDNDRLCAWCVHGLLLVRDEDNDRLCAWCVHGLLLVRDEDNDRLCAWCVHGLLLVRDEDNDRLCAWCVHGLLLVRDEDNDRLWCMVCAWLVTHTDAYRKIIPRLNLRAEHGVRGNIHFTQKGNDPVELELNIDGFKMNAASASLINGFYTHTFGDQTDFCDSLGSHYIIMENYMDLKNVESGK
ncbi:Hypothetical predicted protein [Mytilus galloprovincialis]|uniref:Uncharacterized protein n=1 Tax=Mytilus galloprovincialis TaxID=29158 RepID=A0A8B6H6F1_MYTGA|nr:Hypothetical predicted protein [Mytilus galloprovincialis]